jgi:hypothetical protein
MDGQLSDLQKEQLTQAIFQGRKIEAIKVYRDVTGQGLAESKAAVEQLEAHLRQTKPDLFQVASGKSGCASAVMAAVVLGAAAGAWAAY